MSIALIASCAIMWLLFTAFLAYCNNGWIGLLSFRDSMKEWAQEIVKIHFYICVGLLIIAAVFLLVSLPLIIAARECM